MEERIGLFVMLEICIMLLFYVCLILFFKMDIFKMWYIFNVVYLVRFLLVICDVFLSWLIKELLRGWLLFLIVGRIFLDVFYVGLGLFLNLCDVGNELISVLMNFILRIIMFIMVEYKFFDVFIIFFVDKYFCYLRKG